MYRTASIKILTIISLWTMALSCREKENPVPFYNTADFTPVFLQNPADADQEITHHIGDFSCIDQYGNTITQSGIEGKIHVANFFFTSCGSICPIMTDHMKLVSQAFQDDSNVVLLSFTVTPWIDSVARLHEYAVNKEINDPNWHLLTGDKSEIYTLARQSYFAEEELGFTKDSTDFLHTEHILLVDAEKRIRGIYNGTLDLEIRQLIEDIQLLREE